MKIAFTKDQSAYLAHYVNHLYYAASKTPGAEVQARTAKKMKYKLTGNPLHVFLTGKERNLLDEMLDYRLANLDPMSAETPLVKSIREVIRVA